VLRAGGGNTRESATYSAAAAAALRGEKDHRQRVKV